MHGFNARLNNNLLVQIDGRTLYNLLFSGVFWDTVDYPLEDIERIEIIRGPGASVWDANAVNGVINIITRRPRARKVGCSAVEAVPRKQVSALSAIAASSATTCITAFTGKGSRAMSNSPRKAIPMTDGGGQAGVCASTGRPANAHAHLR